MSETSSSRTEAPERGGAAPDRADRSRTLDAAVDLGFAVLLLVCGVRYFNYHELGGVGAVVLGLAIGAGLAYAWAVASRHSSPRSTAAFAAARTGHAVGVLAATGFWLPLVVLAPSFGWCAFALFFAVHRVLSGWAALLLSGMIVLAVSVGLFLMSSGQDLGLVLGPFFGGLVLAYAYWALDRALVRQRRLITELVETREQLARSEREAGALTERERVASELHDTVVQRTASALLMLESDGLSEGSTAGTEQARGALREALVETRQLMQGLSIPRDDEVSFSETLRAQALDGGASFVVSGTERPLPDSLAHALQRVVREALINVGKHAEAETVRVTLSYFDDAVGVDIADDGVGFEGAGAGAGDDAGDAEDAAPASDPRSNDDAGSDRRTAEHSGFGIRAMTWRMHNLGGSLTIESQPGRGTVVAAVAPYPKTLWTTDEEQP